MTHPVHPRCPSCGEALYKTMVPDRQTRTTDPWAYCRNRARQGDVPHLACPLWDTNQSEKESTDERHARYSCRKRAKVQKDLGQLGLPSFVDILYVLGLNQGDVAHRLQRPRATISKQLKQESLSFMHSMLWSVQDELEAVGGALTYTAYLTVPARSP